jgi:hypothetical protein
MLAMERAATIDFAKAQAWARDNATAINHEGAPRPAFVRTGQSVATAVVLLDTLPAPSPGKVDKIYCQLRFLS